jgi:hypothetical protein
MITNPISTFMESSRKLLIVDFFFALPFLILPLFIALPYRVNIFLSWEGAYRLYLGQTPYEDFGLPMGFGYWLIPALFFKIFGPTFMALVKAQIFINLISLLSLRGLLYNLNLKPIAISITLLVFSLTYILYNFWPWYNHSVVVFEIVALYFLTMYNSKKPSVRNILSLGIAGFFTFLSFFTKQDVGALCFLIGSFLTAYYSLLDKKVYPLLGYISVFAVSSAIFILPFLQDDFTYWFNLGQAPHSSRISPRLMLDIFFSRSLLEKIYLLIILILIYTNFSTWKDFFTNRMAFNVSVLSIALILQSIVTRATSPLPTDHMNYYHTFAFIGIAFFLPWNKLVKRLSPLLIFVALIGLSFSEGYWKYISGIFPKKSESETMQKVKANTWVKSNKETMLNVTLPFDTQQGIDRILALPFLKKENLKVLNMSELTSLAHEIGYVPQIKQPLWYHLNIGIFQKEVDEFKVNIKHKQYDLVLFERIPSLTEFYPSEVLNELKLNYVCVDTFLAPRKLEDSYIDIFIHPELARQFGIKAIKD